jgi:hypothetical protein
VSGEGRRGSLGAAPSAVATPCVQAGFVMAVTRRLWVFPLYHQVAIRDATDDVDRPLWETGEERVVASAQCIVLATRSDLEGEVEIEVRVDTDREERTAGELLFDGELLTTGQGIVVGNSLTDLHHISLPIGWHPLRIYGDLPTDPAWFTVLVDRRPTSGRHCRSVLEQDFRRGPSRSGCGHRSGGMVVIPAESTPLACPN